MRVLFLQQQPCVRALKYAVGLRAARPGLELGFAYRGRTLTELYGAGDELFDRWWRIGPDLGGDLGRVLAAWPPELVHSHNLPDALTVLALGAGGGRVPVIHDVHDMQSLRRTPYEDGFPDPGDAAGLERRAVQGCAGLVAVSEQMLAELDARYALPDRTLVFPNFALARDTPASVDHAEPGDPPRLVYQGTLSTGGGHYDLRAIFAAVCAEGVRLDVYPARLPDAYRALAAATPGLTLHDTLEPSALMRELPRYDLGWAGFDATLNAAHLDTALPNKAFEYLACGLPVLTLQHRALADFLERERLGVSLGGVEGLAARLRALDLPALRRRVAAERHRYTVEANIGSLVELYDAVAARATAAA